MGTDRGLSALPKQAAQSSSLFRHGGTRVGPICDRTGQRSEHFQSSTQTDIRWTLRTPELIEFVLSLGIPVSPSERIR